MKLKVIYASTKPGPEWIEVTPDLVERWEKLFNDMENQVKEINEIFEQVGYTPKYKIEQ